MCCILSSHGRKVVVYKETILDVTKQAICLSNSSLFMLSRTYRIVKRSIGEKKDGSCHLPLFSAFLYWTRHKISKGRCEIDTKMQRDKKVNDAVWKKPKKEEKTNQKEKEKDGVLKRNVVRLKILQKKR